MHPPAFRELAPLQRLATAVLHQVVDDVRSVETPRLIREDACRFVRSPGFLVWCSLTEVNPEAARAKLVLTLAEDDPPGDTRRVIGPTRRGSLRASARDPCPPRSSGRARGRPTGRH